MPGISSILNLAKMGVMANQFNMHITGNNINNVNTQGYSREATIQTPLIPSMTQAGPVGNGANVEQIVRYYDRFLTATLFDNTSIKSGLETRQTGMNAIEQNFNEIEENGVNTLLSEFWTSWDDLANNAEGMPERTALVERANLLAQGIKDRYDFLVNMNSEIDVNLRNVIADINKYAGQVAELNVQITSSESGSTQANDLRDQRDETVRKLSELADIHYFETERGTYTVLIGQGSPLVEGEKTWNLEMRSSEVYWVGSQGAVKQLVAEDVIDGQLGGWLELKQKIEPADTTLLEGSVINTSRNRGINEETTWSQIDGVTVTGDFNIFATGTDQDGLPYSVSFSYIASTNAGASVKDFLLAIEQAFQISGTPPIDRVDARISTDGRLVIEDLMPDNMPISFNIESITGGIYGLGFGKLDGSYPLNYTETLNNWAEEFIKYVNNQHAQGIGLVPITETTSNNRVINQDQPIGYRASGLDYSDNIQNGQFEIWLYDQDGNVIDFNKTTPEVNDPLVIHIQENTTSLNDIRDAINNAQYISSTGAFSGNLGINARVFQGRLVIQVDGTTAAAGFAFGTDSSNTLMAFGLNSLFIGHDASTIEVNPDIKNDLRLVAAAQVELKGSEHISSIFQVSDENRPLGIDFSAGSFNIKIYDENLNVVDEVNIPVPDPDHTTIEDIVDSINEIDGLFAEVRNGKINISVVDKEYHPGSQWIAHNIVLSNNAVLGTSGSGLMDWSTIQDGQFFISRYDKDGVLVEQDRILIDASSTTLADVRDAINGAFTGVNAEIINNQLKISRLFPGDYIEITDDTTNLVTALNLQKNDDTYVVNGKVASIGEDNTGALKYLGIAEGHTFASAFSSTASRNAAFSAGTILSAAASGLDGFSMLTAGQTFVVRAFDVDGAVINSAVITYNAGWTIASMASALDALAFVTATVTPDFRLNVGIQSSAVSIAFDNDSSNIISVLGLDTGVESYEGVLDYNAPLDNTYGAIKDGNFKLHIFNEEGFWQQTNTINITETTTLQQLKNALDAIPGVSAFIRPETIFNGVQDVTTYRLVIGSTNPQTHITMSDDTSFVLDSLGIGQMAKETKGIYSVDRTNEAFTNLAIPTNDGTFNLYMYNSEGRILAPEITGTTQFVVSGTAMPVSGATQFQSMNGVIVSGSFNITYTGRDQYGNLISGIYSGTSSSTLNLFMLDIEATYGSSALGVPLVDAFINSSGQLVVQSTIQSMAIAFQIDEIRPVDPTAGDIIQGLNFGEFGGFINIEVEPDYDGLSDLSQRLDDLYGVRSWVKNGRIEIEGEHQVARISLADDSSGFINSFSLTTPSGGNFSPANNLNALAIRDVNRLEINELDNATFNDYYQQLVSEIGITSRSIKLDYSFYESSVNQLQERRDNISAVSLDEEMANLIKFQHSFTAASKLMKTADEMYLSLLELK